MSSFTIEIAHAVIGVLLIGFDAFFDRSSRYIVPWVAILSTGLALALLLVSEQASAPAFAQNFYSTDSLAFFYKVLALVVTFVAQGR